MTLMESHEGLLVRVGVLDLSMTQLRGADPADVAEQTANALHAYNLGDIDSFNVAFEKPVTDEQAAQFSKKAHILFRQHVGLDQLSLTQMWKHQKLIGTTSLYGCAEFKENGSIRNAFYRGHNWFSAVPPQFAD